MSKHPAEETLSLMDKLDRQAEEIESLRSDYENVCQDIELQNKQMGEWYAAKRQAEDDRDEWKRRANTVWEALNELMGSILSNEENDLTKPLVSVSYQTAIIHKHPEIRGWFKEGE